MLRQRQKGAILTGPVGLHADHLVQSPSPVGTFALTLRSDTATLLTHQSV